MTQAPFGNDPAKVARYKTFWNRDDVRRPLVGFSFVGWFPLQEFAACKTWGSADYLTPDMVDPGAFIEDHIRLLREGEKTDDDLIRGACPGQVAVPWLPGMLGCKLRILPQNAMGEERHLPWDEALQLRLDHNDAWFRKYMKFAEALVRRSNGTFPVSHAAEIGPTDIHAVLRGHTASILDLTDEPEKSAELLWRAGEIFREITEEVWKRIPLYGGGYFDAQYSLWAPGPIIRMQEDATAVYSPALYRKFVQPVDRMLAAHFASSFIHLHSTSMFLLGPILEIEEIRCFEINNDALGPSLDRMVPYFQQVQHARKPLLIRGSFTTEEMRLLMDSLEPRGLFFNHGQQHGRDGVVTASGRDVIQAAISPGFSACRCIRRCSVLASPWCAERSRAPSEPRLLHERSHEGEQCIGSWKLSFLSLPDPRPASSLCSRGRPPCRPSAGCSEPTFD